jgi:hypothetical protein
MLVLSRLGLEALDEPAQALRGFALCGHLLTQFVKSLASPRMAPNPTWSTAFHSL